MLKKGFLYLCILLNAFAIIAIDLSATSWSWNTQLIDGKSIDSLSSRAIAVDAHGNLHITYSDSEALYYTHYDGSQWQYDMLKEDFTEVLFSYPAIALDASGNVHIAYEDDEGLEYITNASGSWVTTNVSWVDRYYNNKLYGICIALDNSGNVHISYILDHYYRGKELTYATNTTGEWVISIIDTETWYSLDTEVHYNYNPAIAIDDSGKAHISYRLRRTSSWDDVGLMYVTNRSGNWVTTLVDSSNSSGTPDSISLSLDTSGNAHIVYSADSDNNLKYATNASGAWVATYVVMLPNNNNPSLTSALDKDNNVHICYYDTNSNALKYATNDSGQWVTTNIADTSTERRSYSSGVSLALDTSDNVYICFIESYSILRYATNASGLWTIHDIEKSREVTGHSSPVIDSSGNVHVSYLDSNNEVIKYATNLSGKWTNTTVDNLPYLPSSYMSYIGLDSSDNIYIGYFDRNGGGSSDNKVGIKYATNIAGNWITNWIVKQEDAKGFIEGDSLAFAVDTNGGVHMGYFIDPYDKTTGFQYSLVYATNASGEWISATIDDDIGSGPDVASLALDISGNAHLCYINGNGDLKYATNISGSWDTTLIKYSFYSEDLSVAIDTSGNVHIISYDGDSIKYINNISGSWITTTVVNEMYNASPPSLALDVTGNAHIGYSDNHYIQYATNASGSWKIYDCNLSGKNAELTIDHSGNPRIIYNENERLRYAYTIPVCEVNKITCSESKLVMNKHESKNITVTLSGKDGCIAEGETIESSINKSGRKRIYFYPESITTDSDGKARFTIVAGEKKGTAKITFSAGGKETTLKVKVKK